MFKRSVASLSANSVLSYLKQWKLLKDKILRGMRKTSGTGRRRLMIKIKKKEIRKKRQQGRRSV